jgi:hypothetical protein
MRVRGCGSVVCCGNLEVERIRTGLERGGRTECKRGGDDLHDLLKCMEKRRWREKLLDCTLANKNVRLAAYCTDITEFRKLGKFLCKTTRKQNEEC